MTKAKYFSSLAIATISGGIIIQTDALKNIFTSADTTMSGQSLSHKEYYFQMHGIETIENPAVETTYPERAQPDDTQSITDLSHWLDVLPYEQDMDRYGYVVYPEHGVVTPFDTPSPSDTQKIRNGEKFDHYKYLDNGALHYRGKDPTEGTGNMVIAAHSSYLKDKPGRYKTVFQALPISSTGDKIFVYLKNANNSKNTEASYDLYIYEINKSFRTAKTDTSVLTQDTTDQILTTYGCYIIGSNSERRVNQATLIDTITDISPTERTHTTNTHDYKEIVDIPIVEDSAQIPTSPMKEMYKKFREQKTQPATFKSEIRETQKKHNVAGRKAPIIPLDPELLPQIDVLVMTIQKKIEANPEKYGGTFITDRLESKRKQYLVDSSKAAGFKVALIEAIQERM